MVALKSIQIIWRYKVGNGNSPNESVAENILYMYVYIRIILQNGYHIFGPLRIHPHQLPCNVMHKLGLP
jgi:hypothetical protein